jgi:glutathione synthase/RimK-type ligase-like ATP-grasp enzyme
MQPLILVLSHAHDSTAHRVLEQIRRRGHQTVLFDPAAFPMHATLSAVFRQAGWQGRLMYEGTAYDLSTIQSIYVRRPNHYQVRTDFPELLQSFLENEAYRGFGGVLRSLDCLWVNPLEAQRVAGFKPLQLQIASEVGLPTPPTLITNDPEAVRSFFFEVCQGQMIYKTLHGNFFLGGGQTYHLIYTSRVTREHLAELERVRLTAHLFQPFIDKAFEVRATVIGQQVLAVAIESQRAAASQVDWRASYRDLRYRIYELPSELARQCVRLVERLGLVFGALDLIVTPDGDHVFLECNAGGQWEWLEEKTKLPFAATLAEVLIAGKEQERDSECTRAAVFAQPASAARDNH